MTYSEVNNYIRSLRTVGMQMGLDRIRDACTALGHPECAYPIVHIAGTNGKGSTASMIASMLIAGGYRVGSYTSPALFSARETITVNGKPISTTRFTACADRVKNAYPTGLSEYEFLTAVMFCCLEEERIDIAIIECCLGGEEDVTNVIPAPLCAVFTPIALDHTAILGNTLEEITRQKSGIAKAPAKIVCAPRMPEEALAVLLEKAAANGQAVYNVHSPHDIRCTAQGTTFSYGDETITMSLLGAHQADNAATAMTVIEQLGAVGFPVAWDQAISALRTVSMPCRLEHIERGVSVLLDGAHNPHGIAALCKTIESVFDRPITLVIGMLADKDIERCLRQLSSYCETMICCTPQDTSRALPAEQLAQIASRYCKDVRVIDDPWDAFQNAEKATATSLIVVGGSFYTAAYVRRRLIDSNKETPA